MTTDIVKVLDENGVVLEVSKKEIEDYEEYEIICSEWNYEMQKIEDAMWQEACRSLIKNNIKPLACF